MISLNTADGKNGNTHTEYTRSLVHLVKLMAVLRGKVCSLHIKTYRLKKSCHLIEKNM